MSSSNRDAFIRLFNNTAKNRHRYEVFRDFVTMSAISIHNAINKSETLENEYLDIVKRYHEDDVQRMCALLSEVVMGLEVPNDFLGSVFMELELGNSRAGQFFTPYPISVMMAKMLHGDSIKATSGKPFTTLQEPACGSGGMIIAYVHAMLDEGINPQQALWVSAIDVDSVPAMMCYLQLSLLHIPAEIIVGNALSMEIYRVMRTPAHYLGYWDSKLKHYWHDNDHEMNIVENPKLEVAVLPPSVVEHDDSGQLNLFDVMF